MAAGRLNGLLVTRINLPPFIVTLGTLSIFTAIALLYSGGESIQADHLPDILNFLGEGFAIGDFRLTWGIVVVVLIYVVVGFVLAQTAWGRYVYAVGDDPESARLSGVPSKRILLAVYTVAGLIYGSPRGSSSDAPARRPQRRPGRQPAEHHRGGHRRHEPVRRPGPAHRHR